MRMLAMSALALALGMVAFVFRDHDRAGRGCTVLLRLNY